MLRFDWVKQLAKYYGQSPELGIRLKKRNLARPYQFNVIRIGKKLANPYILVNYYVPL